MKIAIISDIHANIEALQAVFSKVDELHPDVIICLGDLVGYGPFPNECIERIREKEISTVLGNHDAAITGSQNMEMFREPNRSLLKWTASQVTKDNLSYLMELPLTMKFDNSIAAHASPSDPHKWPYMDSAVKCRNLFSEFDEDFCFIGHTHVPGLIPEQPGIFRIKSGIRYIINPGSVSQSRDQDKRASFGLMDMNKLEYKNYRVNYSNQKTYERLDDMGYSDKEIRRLLNS